MLPNATRKGPILCSALLLVAASALAVGCSGGSDAPAHPAANAPAASAAPKTSGTPGKPATAPKPAEAAPATAGTKADAKTDPKTPGAAAVSAQEGSTPTTATPAPVNPAPEPKVAAKEEPLLPTKAPPEKPASLSAASNTPESRAAQAKAEAQKEAQKLGDPNSQDADPNSKAKLTYEFGTDSKNFGKCMQGDVLTNKFLLQSSGEEDLVIKQAKPTCGCTVAQVAVQAADGSLAPYNFGSPIPPGRKIEISATLHTQNKRGHAASRINIFSNDPRGQTQLGLEADVDPFFQMNPQNMNFNAISARDTANDKVVVTTTRGEKVKLSTPLEGLPNGLKLELTPSEPDADGKSAHWELACHLGPGLVEGNLAYTATLKSDIAIPGGEKLPSGSEPTYEVAVPIMARITGMISYTPAFVSLGLIRPGQVVSRVIRITSHDPYFKLTEPKVVVQGREGGEWDLASHFSTVIRPVAGENAVEVELRLDGMPESLNGSFSGTLNIQVGHPEKPEIKLPITGVCRGGAVGTPAQGPAPAPAPNPAPGDPPK